MPAASWRIMPARSISRCETISASFGVSGRVGRKKEERRMRRVRIWRCRAGGRVKADRAQKHNPGRGSAEQVLQLSRAGASFYCAAVTIFSAKWRRTDDKRNLLG